MLGIKTPPLVRQPAATGGFWSSGLASKIIPKLPQDLDDLDPRPHEIQRTEFIENRVPTMSSCQITLNVVDLLICIVPIDLLMVNIDFDVPVFLIRRNSQNPHVLVEKRKTNGFAASSGRIGRCAHCRPQTSHRPRRPGLKIRSRRPGIRRNQGKHRHKPRGRRNLWAIGS